MAKLKAFYVGINTWVGREVFDLLDQPAHIRQAETFIVAESKADAVRYAQDLWKVGRWVGEPTARDLSVADRPDIRALGVAGYLAARAVFVKPMTGGRGDGVVRIDENGPTLIGRIVGNRQFEPAGTLHVAFSPDAVQALRALFGLIHYDDLALEWRAMLPGELLLAVSDSTTKE